VSIAGAERRAPGPRALPQGGWAHLRGRLVVVKYGGAVMDDGALARSFARDVVELWEAGVALAVVHGGGPALTRTLERMGISSAFEGGHRVTTAEAAEVAEMVLSGGINKRVVSLLNRAGARAIGLSGTDASIVRVKRLRPGGRDIGFVGRVERVETALLTLLLDHGYLPVISSTAADAKGRAHNINADLVAGAVAGALGAARLVVLSDVPGVMVDGAMARRLTPKSARRLLADDAATGGMRPKLEASIAALAAGVPEVRVADGRIPRALTLALRGPEDGGTGTRLTLEGGPRP